jgi:hypothetical protein
MGTRDEDARDEAATIKAQADEIAHLKHVVDLCEDDRNALARERDAALAEVALLKAQLEARGR